MVKTILAVCLALLMTATAQSESGNDEHMEESLSNQTGSTPVIESAENSAAVEELQDKIHGMEESLLETRATVDKLKKIKVSGYVQTQFRMAVDRAGYLDGAGKAQYAIGDLAGGAFGEATWMQLQVRRGRIKVAYETELSQAVVQLDCIPRAVTIKDAFLLFKEPVLKSFALKAGVFDRPFGYEIGYSSGSRESPERSRLFQTLFPGERDLGASLEYQAADALPEVAHMINFKAGVFTGNGMADETDLGKDIIGRLGFSLPFTNINLAIDGGVSGYLGTITNTDTTWSRTVAAIDSSKYTTVTRYDSTGGTVVPVLSAVRRYDTTWTVAARGYSYEIPPGSTIFVKSDAGMLNEQHERRYLGADLQLYYDLPVIGGITLRGEYIQGIQPGTKSSSRFYSPGRNSNQPVYTRKFSGFYGMLVQNINPLNSQLVLKYDFYDPNTAVTGDQIDFTGLNKGGLSSTDLAYTTIGAGVVYHWDANLKFMLYYDRVSNERMNGDIANAATSSTATDADRRLARANLPFTNELNDDVLTFRIQYRF